jgi:indole-3-glycerol phosphate synthase
MAAASRERTRRARAMRAEAALLAEARALPAPPALVLERFDVIAELKLRSPAAGGLADAGFDRHEQLRRYARAGAAAISVLTEPDEFKGDLAHLAEAAELLTPLGCPVMRKDFLTDAYQVLEARAAGASGVLVIVTMLDDATLGELVACARELGLFVLLEAFDAADLERIARLAEAGATAPLLAGVNCRDLRDLSVRFERFAELAPHLPRALPAVAESGIATPADARTVAAAGYALALVGSSLMRAADPAAALGALLEAGRSTAGAARAATERGQ